MNANAQRGPRVRVVPPKAVDFNDGRDAVDVLGHYGLRADPWQADVLTDWMSRRADGNYAAAIAGLAVPRQNGKNAVIEMREFFGAVFLGEKFIHTAHEVKSARKAFMRLAAFFENERKYPELAALVRADPNAERLSPVLQDPGVRKGNGQEAIVLNNGGSIEFSARSRGAARGFTVDILVCDEAQELTDEELEALKPTISAAPLRNSQTIYTGTPPSSLRMDKPQGEVFRRTRQAGQDGTNGRLAWTDFGAADGPLPDIADRSLWPFHNPAMELGRLSSDAVESEFIDMSDHGFARERFGWWGDPEAGRSVISLTEWGLLAIEDAPVPTSPVLVIDVAPDRSSASIGVASMLDDRRVLVMCFAESGTKWVARKVADLVRQRNAFEVALWPGSQAGSLIPDLVEAGVDFERMTNADMGAACAAFQESVKRGEVGHLGQDALTMAVSNARTRYVGELELWDRRDPHGPDISPLVAVSIAAYRWGIHGRTYDVLTSVY